MQVKHTAWWVFELDSFTILDIRCISVPSWNSRSYLDVWMALVRTSSRWQSSKLQIFLRLSICLSLALSQHISLSSKFNVSQPGLLHNHGRVAINLKHLKTQTQALKLVTSLAAIAIGLRLSAHLAVTSLSASALGIGDTSISLCAHTLLSQQRTSN